MGQIFGIAVSKLSKKDLCRRISRVLLDETGPKMFIVTLNPEIALIAKNEPDYAKIIASSQVVVDGFGIKLALWRQGENFERITGVEICRYLLEEANRLRKKVLVVFRKDGFSSKEEIVDYLKGSYGQLDHSVIEKDQFSSRHANEHEVLIVALGAPDQERFIAANKDSFRNLKVAIGVGGTFDFWTGKKRRAPKFMQKIGMEWMWRAIIQPNRIRRTYRATIKFPYQVLRQNNE